MIFILGIVGCEEENTNKVVSNGEKIDTTKMTHEHRTRLATAKDDMEVSLNYEVYYTGEILNLVQSEEKVTSNNSANLDEYETAYRKIKTYYEGLSYYDIEIIRESNSVTNKAMINYDKIDIGKLLDIEGEEDNIIENGVAKISKWKELAKKLGAKCTEVVEET